MKIMGKYNKISILLGIGIVISLFYFADFNKILDILKNTNAFFLTIATIAYLLNNVAISYRLRGVIEKIDKKIRFSHVFSAHMSGMIASDVTPARSGYIYSVIPLKKKGVSQEKAISAITYCYLFDLIIKGTVGTIAVFFLLNLIGIPSDVLNVLIMGLGSLTVFIILGLIFFNFKIPLTIKNKIEQNRIGNSILTVKSYSTQLNNLIPMILSISLIGWILRGIEWFFIAKSVGVDLTVIQSLLFHPLLTSLSMIPFTSAGLGIQEIGISEIFVLSGIALNTSIAFAILVRVMNTAVDTIGLKGFFLLDITGKKLKEEYETISGDIDEKSYNSNLLVQRYWQRRRIGEMIKNLNIKDNDFILDVGCGSGVLSTKCIEQGSSVVGFDLNYNAVKYIHSKNMKKSSFLIADAQNLPFKSNIFDGAVCGTIIEHVPNPEKMVGEITRVLKTNGKICITTPNSRSLWPLIEELWDRFGRGRNYGETHLRIYNEKNLKNALKDYNIYHFTTLFVIAPFIALFNSKKLLNIIKGIDYKLEKIGIGSELLICGSKKK